MRVAVIGVGLIGGSVGMAARERLGAEVTGYDPSEDALRVARERGAVDTAAGSIGDALRDAEAAFVAAPVGALPQLITAVLEAAPRDCVVSDVGSVKRSVVAGRDDPRFVGGHPLAGAETAGVAHARADLFEGAIWYLVPRETTSGVLYERLHRLLHKLGARPAAIDAEAHDRMLAAVSHLPHVLANVLVARAARTMPVGSQRLPGMGPSLRDAVRVAGAPSTIWTDIYLSNREPLIAEIDGTIAGLQAVRRDLEDGDGDAIRAWNDAAADDRRRLLEGDRAGEELHELRAAVPNRPGVIAQLALELGRAGVNIVDMALYPATDMSEGVVALWVSGPEAADRAERLVDGLGFPVARP